MSALPYLHDSHPDMGQRAVEICGSTFPLSYLGSDEGQFEDQREIFADPDNLILPSAFRLTWQFVTEAHFYAEIRVWETMRGLADIYLKCRWDVNAVVQTAFCSSEFTEKRSDYMRETVEPLE